MKPTSSSAREPKYPEYYILDVHDLIEELATKWHEVIASEVYEANAQREEDSNTIHPEVYTIDPITGAMQKQVYVAQHQAIRTKPWQPDISFVIHHVIEAIKQRPDMEGDLEMNLQLLEYDIATMTHCQLAPNIPMDQFSNVYSDTRMKLAKLTANFGKKLFFRLVSFGLYKQGYFPYHFAGWQDTCALVELDATHR